MAFLMKVTGFEWLDRNCDHNGRNDPEATAMQRWSGVGRWTAFSIGTLSLLLALGNVFASEGGQTHYPVGVNTIMNGLLPPPGETELFNYSQYYGSTRFNGDNGRQAISDFKANVVAWAPRIAHTWTARIGPFFLASTLATPMSRVDIRAFGKRDISSGFGDPDLSPVLLYYVNESKTFFAYVGPDIYIPIGRYDKNRMANNGLNYWTIAPNAMFTWMPNSRLEVSGTIYSEFNFKNNATNYRSGNDVVIDFGVGYRPVKSVPNLKVSIQGFALNQFSDDEIGGAIIDGKRGRAFGLGPQISIDIAHGKGGIVLKYQREFGVRNRAQGDKFWFELAVPI